MPSPCGANALCRVVNERPVCSCAASYIGRPPYCRPECMINSECPSDKACVNERCADPCAGACGPNTECHVQLHLPRCVCSPGYNGEPFSGCSKIIPCKATFECSSFFVTLINCNILLKAYDPPQSPCALSPCGINAVCNERNGAGSCSCVPEFFGDPYVECRPECVTNSDCPKSRSCVNNKCLDPCSSGTCGINAECRVFSHSPSCSCLEGYTGNPSSSCHRVPEICKRTLQL